MDDQLFDASLTKCQNKEHEQSAYNIHPTDTSVKVTAQVLDDLLSLWSKVWHVSTERVREILHWEQICIIQDLIDGKDVILIAKTGFGKSIWRLLSSVCHRQ